MHKRKKKPTKPFNPLADIPSLPGLRAISPEDEAKALRALALLKDVIKESEEYWLHGFAKDIHPDREIGTWDLIAQAYTRFCTLRPSLSLKGKKEVLGVLLMRCGSSDDWVLERNSFKLLTRDDVQQVMAYLKDAAKTPETPGVSLLN